MNLFRKIVAKCSKFLDMYKICPPYEYVQNIVERHLGDYVGGTNSEVKKIIIVGGYLGNEVSRLLKSYHNSDIIIFEASERYRVALDKKFQRNERVTIRPVAISNYEGKINFFETNLKGSGSILKVGALAEVAYGIEQRESFEVNCSTLDLEILDSECDCLWIDVQGAELLVLEGAKELLLRTKSIFIEVSKYKDLYEGSVTMKELEAFLSKYGFEHTLLGLDKAFHTGNAFFSKPNFDLVFKKN